MGWLRRMELDAEYWDIHPRWCSFRVRFLHGIHPLLLTLSRE
jgi:hypothetical protein